MQLGLRTKLTLIMTGLVLLSVTVLSSVFFEQLLQLVMHDTDKHANELAQEIFDSAHQAVVDAKTQGLRPASDNPVDTHEYVKRALEMSESLDSRMKSATAESPSIYEVSIVDRDGIVLVSSDPSSPGKVAVRRPPFAQLVQSPFVRQVRILTEKPHIYEVDLPFGLRGDPFADVRVSVSTALLLEDVKPRLKNWGTLVALALVLSTILAAVVSGAALAPIRDILAQLERISAGEVRFRAADGERRKREYR